MYITINTFGLVVFIVLFFQLIYCLFSIADRSRWRFLILLACLAIHNAILFFPDAIAIHSTFTHKLFNLIELTISGYFAYFFYKAFHLNKKAVLKQRRVIYLLSLSPVIFLFLVPLVFDAQEAASKLHLLFPLAFGGYLIYATTLFLLKKETRVILKMEGHLAVIDAVFISLISWAIFPLLTLVINHAYAPYIMNLPFAALGIISMGNSLKKANRQNETTTKSKILDFTRIARAYNYTPTETLVVKIFLQETTVNKEIADKLNVSDSTLKSHFSAIFKKTGVRNRTELIIKIYQDAFGALTNN